MLLIIDFGSQLSRVLERSIDKLGYAYEYQSYKDVNFQSLDQYSAFVVSGSHQSFDSSNTDHISCMSNIVNAGKPILGICYGMYLLVNYFGGKVGEGQQEFGIYLLNKIGAGLDIDGFDGSYVVMSHTQSVLELPKGFKAIYKTKSNPYSLIVDESNKYYGAQFHPESLQSTKGYSFINFFLSQAGVAKHGRGASCDISRCNAAFANVSDDDKIFCAVSGGVDSTVVAATCKQAGKNIDAFMFDTGFLRFNDVDIARETFKQLDIPLQVVDLKARFFEKMKGIYDPEGKRQAISELYFDCIKEYSKGYKFIAQGTIKTDIIESGCDNASKIKTHHNVSMKDLDLELLEPLKDLFKDEVRALGKKIGVNSEVLNRMPFPGPGLAIRVIGDVTEQKIDIIRRVDQIVHQWYLDNIDNFGDNLWQIFPVMSTSKSVGVKGDARVHGNIIAIRAVYSIDGMTAEPVLNNNLDYIDLSQRVISGVSEVSKVVLDISPKPPSTIEWE